MFKKSIFRLASAKVSIATVSIATLTLLSSCRFVVPGSSETAALGERGAFSSGAPAWAKVSGDQSQMLPANSGIMPRTHTVPAQVSMSAAANASSSVNSGIGRGLNDERNVAEASRREKTGSGISRDDISGKEGKTVSPIAAVEKNCPGSERAVVDALKTEKTTERIRKYLALTRQCPNSAEIWVWLARDYYTSRRYSDARRCLQAALTIDPENTEGKSLQAEMLKGATSQKSQRP